MQQPKQHQCNNHCSSEKLSNFLMEHFGASRFISISQLRHLQSPDDIKFCMSFWEITEVIFLKEVEQNFRGEKKKRCMCVSLIREL